MLQRKKVLSIIVILIFILSLFVFQKAETLKVSAFSDTYKTRMGTNIEGISDWSRSMMFVDVMKQSRAWGQATAPWTAISEVDAHGWPTTDAGVVVMCASIENGKVYYDISGTYKLSFEGTATLSPNSCQFTISNQVYSNGITTADLIVPSGQSQIMISFTNTNGGVRNVKMIRPGYLSDTNQIFTNDFLAALAPFSTLRFMEFLVANSQDGILEAPYYSFEPQEWSNRRLTTDASQAGMIHGQKGSAYEYVVALANLTGKDVWINIPSNASDDYIIQLATFLKNTLNSDIHVYIEFSNEVWNWMFPQTHANRDLASANPIANGSIQKMYAIQTVRMGELFKQVYGQSEMISKIRPILAWQFSSGAIQSMLQFINDTYGNPAQLIYAGSVAPYFQEPLPEDCTSVEVIHSTMIANSDDSVTEKVRLINYGKEWGLQGGIVCYEGGPHHRGQVDVNLEIRKTAQRAPEMKAILKRDLQTNWFDLDGGMFMYYTLCGSYSVYGCWGLTESINDLTFPKYVAISELSSTKVDYSTPAPPPTSVPDEPGMLSGTPFSSDNIFSNAKRAFDGNLYNYINLPSSSYYGLDLGTPQVITKVKIYPRYYDATTSYLLDRAVGTYQGSNDGLNYTNLFSIHSRDSYVYGRGNFSEFPVTNTQPFRYIRHLGTMWVPLEVNEVKVFGVYAEPTPVPTIDPNIVTNQIDGVIVANGMPAGMKTKIIDDGSNILTVSCVLKGRLNINSFSWALQYDKSKVIPVKISDYNFSTPDLKISTSLEISPYFETRANTALTGYTISSFQLENTNQAASGNYFLIGFSKQNGNTISLSDSQELTVLNFKFKKLSAYNSDAFSYYNKTVNGTVVNKLIYDVTNILQSPTNIGSNIYTRPALFTIEMKQISRSVTFSVSSAAQRVNTGDSVYNDYMNGNSGTTVTVRNSYLTLSVIQNTTVPLPTKTSVLINLADQKYLLSILRKGYLRRDVPIVVAGENLSLGDKPLVAGDVYVDGIIDGSDSELLFSKIGNTYVDAAYDIACDFNNDGVIDGTDTEKLFSGLGFDVIDYHEYVNYYI